MISVMILGHGLTKSGIMDKLVVFISRFSSTSKRKLIAIVSILTGSLSAFIQNIGAVALFLPAVLKISKKKGIPASELIMPLGFSAILGGTLTMIASGPLILSNALLKKADLEPYGLFAITPVGLCLLLGGILLFFFFGKKLLPSEQSSRSGNSVQKKLIDTWHLPHQVCYYDVPANSSLIGQTPEMSGIWNTYGLNILAISNEDKVDYAPWRHTRFDEGQQLVLLGDKHDIQRFTKKYDLNKCQRSHQIKDLEDPEYAGFVEVVIPSQSTLVGKSIRDISFRKHFAVEPVLVFSREEQIKGDFSDRRIRAGDTLILYGAWDQMVFVKNSQDFVVITPFEAEEKPKGKALIALLCFLGAVGLAIAGLPLSLTLFTGAIMMVLTGVIGMEDAYRAIEWKVVFLIAGLIPLGIAMQKTGTAAFLAEKLMGFPIMSHPLILLSSIAVISSVFSLFMSNVASIVVLAPLVIGMANISGLDPRPLVLLTAVCAANSFILPTHQVNAFLITPGGYQNRDYLKAGGLMSILFLIIVVSLFYFFYI